MFLLVVLFICCSLYAASVELVVYLCLMVFFSALSPLEAIGTHGVRNFLLCKKPQSEIAKNAETEGTTIARRGHGRWKSWINKTLSLKIASHWSFLKVFLVLSMVNNDSNAFERFILRWLLVSFCTSFIILHYVKDYSWTLLEGLMSYWAYNYRRFGK